MLNLSLCFLTTRSLFVAFPSLHAYISLLSLCFSCGSFANWSIQKKFSFTSTPKMLYLNHIYGTCLPPYTYLFIQASSLGMVVNLQSEDWGGRDLTGQLWVNACPKELQLKLVLASMWMRTHLCWYYICALSQTWTTYTYIYTCVSTHVCAHTHTQSLHTEYL